MAPSDFGIYEALVHPYRRRLLVAMLDADRRDAPYPDPLEFAPDAEEERHRIGMIHTHLPKLDDMGVIQWDRETEELSKGPRWDDLEPLLRWMDENRDELPEGWLPEPTGDWTPPNARSES
ncbi:DUF7344 domain-containing protein [Haloplanus aerogenes]|nr:ArsR family transcriptional regulator [Haloplanus aerogenes]AZH26195.1 ArsR family transcriptional regulator [Haloplanus aerogenes]